MSEKDKEQNEKGLIPYNRGEKNIIDNEDLIEKYGLKDEIFKRHKELKNKLDFNTKGPFAEIPNQVNSVVKKVIETHTKDLWGNAKDLNSQEENISATLASDITHSLMGEIKNALDNKIIGDYTTRVIVSNKQIQEKDTGADLFGVCTIKIGDRKLNKYYLCQAKVGTVDENGVVTCKNPKIIDQASQMFGVSPSSYFMIYTKLGFEIVSALNVLNFNKNEINTREIQGISFAEFNKLFLDCMIGDNRCEKAEWKKYLDDPRKKNIPEDINLIHIKVEKIEAPNSNNKQKK